MRYARSSKLFGLGLSLPGCVSVQSYMRDLVLHHYMKWEYRSHIDWDPSTMSAKAEGVTVIAPVLLSHFPTPTVVPGPGSRSCSDSWGVALYSEI